MTLNPFRALFNWRMRVWNRNVLKLIGAIHGTYIGPRYKPLEPRELSTFVIWHDVFPSWSVYRVHAFVDEMEKHGYVTSRLQTSGPERRYMMRRVVAATDLGRALAEKIAIDASWA